MNIKPINYYINPADRNFGRAEYSLGVLFEGIGLPSVSVNDISEAEIIYSTECPNTTGTKVLWIKCCQNNDWNTTAPPVFWENGIPWLGQKNVQGEICGDILYSTYGLLTGVFETEESKDQWGVPIARGGLYESLGLLHYPWVAKYCEILYSSICASFQVELQRVPLWPDNKRYAIVMSHDVDAPFSFIDTDFRKKWLSKLILEKRYNEFSRGVLGYAGTITKKIAGIYPKSNCDPNFCFESWVEFQRTLKSKSAFYVATVTSADQYGDSSDVNYIHSRQDIVQVLQCLMGQGWEIGLHGSINAWRAEERLYSEKVALQKVLGEQSLIGIRHHYWALDDKVPERTLAMHARVGFKYDSSLGLNDAPGYRRGIAWPFNPYDKSSERMLPIIEIPPTIMDGGIFYRDVTPSQGKKEILDHIKRTFESGGAVVMNWHLEQLNPSRLRRAGPTLVDALLELVNDSEIYWASPKELSQWWSARREKLKAFSQ